MMKRFALVLTAALLGLALLAGCGGNAASQNSTAPPTGGGALPGNNQADLPASTSTSQSTPQSESAPPPAGSASAASSTETNTPGQQNQADGTTTVTGIIDDSGMGKIYVQLDEGVVVGFEYAQADTSGLTENMPGSPISVTYSGTLQGNDTSAIVVLKMETPEA